MSTERTLQAIMVKYGKYYVGPDLFYHRLWRDRLREIGFVVTCLEKLDAHHVWQIRLRGTLRAQTSLLMSKPAGQKILASEEPLTKQLELELRRIAKEMGSPIQRDHLNLTRTGKLFEVSFIWPPGKAGRLLRMEKKPDAFSFHMRFWLRRSWN